MFARLSGAVCFKGVQFVRPIKTIFDYFHSQISKASSKNLHLRQVIIAESCLCTFMTSNQMELDIVGELAG